MPGVLPPAARTPPPRLAAAPSPRTGPYSGSGHLVFNPGARGACRDVIPITDFAVAGNSASFRGSSAEINRDGSVQIQAGRRWVTGYFAGPRFEGRLWEPPPACTYALSLAPVG